MLRFRISIKRLLIWVVPIATVVAMVARATMSWGPMNLIVLTGFVLAAAEILACLPIIPHRPFWAGLAACGLIYAVICSFGVPGIERMHLPTEVLYQKWAANYYGPVPHWKTARGDEMGPDEYRRSIDSFVAACHAVTVMGFGVLGGFALLALARAREARRWDREALPELPLEEFLLPPLKVDRPSNS